MFKLLKDRFSASELAYLQAVLMEPNASPKTLTPQVIEAAAHEVLTYRPYEAAHEVAKRRSMILMRAHARVAAQKPRALGPDDLAVRRGHDASDIAVQQHETPYSNYFAATELTLTHSRFDGTRSDPMERAVFLMADAVTVLPYDPVRDRVLVVEQLRMGPYARGDQKPWMLEPIAGRVEPGQLPEQAAHREAQEEARLELGALHLVASYYPSPGAITEYLTCYVGITDLPDESVGVAGLAEEQEDIASSLMSFETLMTLADSSALDTGPLFISALWLARHRDRLRAQLS